MEQNFETRIINNIRILCADMIQKPNSGHPGMPMGMAPVAYVLWNKIMNYNPKNPKWWNRDRFVLSNGHGCALLYSMLHLTGYSVLSLEDLKSFRSLESKTPGHPEASSWNSKHDGIEVTTGPLGQGMANAVGLAIGEAHLAAVYNKEGFTLFDNYTYVFCGDGCLQEGISSESSSLAGHLGLGKLIVVYDDNKITIDGETDLSFTENVTERYQSYGWQVLDVQKGDDDLVGIEKALLEAKKDTKRPTLIRLHTTIGFGSSKQGKEDVHGSPLGVEELKKLKEKFGFDSNQHFFVDEKVRQQLDHTEKGNKLESDWNVMFQKYSEKYPELAKELTRRFKGELPEGWKNVLPTFKHTDKPEATRILSGNVLRALANIIPDIVGGSADLNPSTKTYLNGSSDFQKETPQGKNIRFGVREHAMCAIQNGLAAYGGFIPFGATFLNFIGYAFGAVILSALSEFRTLYIFTHDSPGLGEDGPTHQPVDKYAMCRSLPNLLFMRPCDGNETSGCYALALENNRSPTVLSLTRQNVPHLEGTSIDGCYKGAYVLKNYGEGKPELILVGSGSEVHLCVGAAQKLNFPTSVVSFPCWEIFEKQSEEYKLSVFPEGVPVLSIEAGVTLGWSKYAHASIGIDSYGLSGPYEKIFQHFGITVENLVEKSLKVREFYKGKQAPSLIKKPF
eukprot:TRINITY_DN653_c1_g1_i2.p1 TRINITY_DN653_c1_g1~~TRINITY_DN653_c1_g1_i2.p1  ORF type:complete len:677 (-),score=222.50 TRINITY_DN653_c1_g1_i2:43-2073(-)